MLRFKLKISNFDQFPKKISKIICYSFTAELIAYMILNYMPHMAYLFVEMKSVHFRKSSKMALVSDLNIES